MADESGAKAPMPSGGLGRYRFARLLQQWRHRRAGLARRHTHRHIGRAAFGHRGHRRRKGGLSVKHKYHPSSIGVIDSDYRGEIRVRLCNVSDKPHTIRPGDRARSFSAPGGGGALWRQSLSPSERGRRLARWPVTGFKETS